MTTTNIINLTTRRRARLQAKKGDQKKGDRFIYPTGEWELIREAVKRGQLTGNTKIRRSRRTDNWTPS